MSSRLDEILQQLATGELSLDEACREVGLAAKADQAGT